jgi:tetrahydromethanopterin S-methyltransferase subunit G
MPTSQYQAQRIEKESQIKNEFSEMQKSLDELKKKVDNGDR